MTSTNPQSAPTKGRVNKVSATTEAPAIPTITTHLNTASSEIFIQHPSIPVPKQSRTGAKTKPGKDAGSEKRGAH